MNPSPEERPVRAASTLILLRDAADGVEVLWPFDADLVRACLG